MKRMSGKIRKKVNVWELQQLFNINVDSKTNYDFHPALPIAIITLA
jgi:hypothetical protein